VRKSADLTTPGAHDNSNSNNNVYLSKKCKVTPFFYCHAVLKKVSNN